MIARITALGFDLKVFKTRGTLFDVWSNSLNGKKVLGLCVFGLCFRLGHGYYETVAA